MFIDPNAFYREVSLRLTRSLDLAQNLDELLEYLQQRVPADSIALGLGDLEAARIQLLATASATDDGLLWQAGTPELRMSRTLAAYTRRRLWERQRALVVNRPVDQPPCMVLRFPDLERASAMFIPLPVHDRVGGVLILSAVGLDRYSPRHVQLMESVRAPLHHSMRNGQRHRELHHTHARLVIESRALAQDLADRVGTEVIGAQGGLQAVMDRVHQLAPSTEPVLLLGEAGTGKRVIAHALHRASRRHDGPCITLPAGPHRDQDLQDALERARGGTLLIDDLSALSSASQKHLFDVLLALPKDGQVPWGADSPRIVATTHQDLEQRVRTGALREDLWYHLQTHTLRLPPLRMRTEDIPALTDHLLHRAARTLRVHTVPRIPAHARDQLARHPWPGNIRELQHVLEHAIVMSSGPHLELPTLAPTPPSASTARPIVATLDQAMHDHICSVLEHVGWQVAGDGGAAEVLGVNPSTLRFRMKKLGVQKPRLR